MESPPQFAPPAPPPKKSNALLIIVLSILGVCALCCVGMIIFSMNLFGKMKNSLGCIMHYSFARQAISSYATAHSGKLPKADSWQDDIAPYYGKEAGGGTVNGGPILDLGDASKDLGCAAEKGSVATGMAYNKDLAGKTLDQVRQTPSAVLLFEVPQTGRNLSERYKLQAGDSPNKIMGQARQWIVLPVNGNVNINPGGSTTPASKGMNGL